MRPRVVLPLVALVLLVGAMLPSVHAQGAHFEDVKVTLHQSRIDVELSGGKLEGKDAADLRRAIDQQHGDNDGLLTDDEVEAYIQDRMASDNQRLATFAPTLTRGLLIEGRQPHTVRVIDITMENMRGATDREDLITQTYDAELVFANNTKDRVNVTFSQDFRHALPGLSFDTATFHTQAPWAVDDASIRDGAGSTFYGNGTFTVTYSEIPNFASEDDPLWFDIIDTEAIQPQKDKKKGSPGVGPAMLIAALGFTFLALRRAND